MPESFQSWLPRDARSLKEAPSDPLGTLRKNTQALITDLKRDLARFQKDAIYDGFRDTFVMVLPHRFAIKKYNNSILSPDIQRDKNPDLVRIPLLPFENCIDALDTIYHRLNTKQNPKYMPPASISLHQLLLPEKDVLVHIMRYKHDSRIAGWLKEYENSGGIV